MTIMSGNGSHSHGAGGSLDDDARGILTRGIERLLEMTDGLAFRPLVSEKFPLPLVSVAHAWQPDPQALREDVRGRLADDPVAVLEDVLALLELHECNQADIAEHVLDDMAFVGTVFASKRCNGWIAIVGDGDRAALESAVNARWQFQFFSGPSRPTGIYVLLNMLARYAYVYGRIASGDGHEMAHFIEDFCPGLIVCRGRLSELELALSLAAMKMGVPAVVPRDYPFPLGRTIRADAPAEIVEAVAGFANIRRLLDVPDIPQLPDYCDLAAAGEQVIPAVTWGSPGDSFLVVRKGGVSAPGFGVVGSPAGPIGVVVTIDAEPMDAFDCTHIEQAIAGKLATIPGVAAEFAEDGFRIHQGEGVQLDPHRVGEVLLAAVGNQFPKLKDAASVEVIFDAAALAKTAPGVLAEKQARAAAIAAATEETVNWFVGCTGCSPFAPDHVCIVTPQRLPQCSRNIAALKADALYAYDDMSNIHHGKLQAGVNSFQVFDPGRCLDAARGEWSGANEHVARMTQGRTTRVFLHCLDEHPHTACGCFGLVLFETDRPRPGVGIMGRGYEGACPDGRTWKDLYYQLAGKQAPGLTGAGRSYLLSPKFLQSHGGWDAVVWVSPDIAELLADRLPPAVEVGPDASAP